MTDHCHFPHLTFFQHRKRNDSSADTKREHEARTRSANTKRGHGARTFLSAVQLPRVVVLEKSEMRTSGQNWIGGAWCGLLLIRIFFLARPLYLTLRG